ncbi:60S acidic ribosomal protein P1 [Orbilia javanica]|uniref:Large ribosomal subunit protein P1 n=1 Tax=Orbilia javanica TaxID=47235 RepID=A0AAN8NB34_9PEZI
MASQEIAISYAALILADEGIEITPDKLQKLLDAAKVEVEPIWTVLFAKALQGKDMNDLLLNISAGGSAGPVVVDGTLEPKGDETQDKEETKEEKKEEAGEESDDDMGLGLFD